MSQSNQISDELLKELKELYNISPDKSTLPNPEEVKSHPFLMMAGMLQSITDSMTETDEQSNNLFAEYYSVCLRGINPFSASVLKKAGVDSKEWKKLIKGIAGENE